MVWKHVSALIVQQLADFACNLL